MYVKDFAAGMNHTCALTQASEICCGGRNDHGQLGDWSYVSNPTPRPVLFR